jgi:Phophatidylserine decarboxylase
MAPDQDEGDQWQQEESGLALSGGGPVAISIGTSGWQRLIHLKQGAYIMEHRGGGSHRIGRWLAHQDALEDWLEGLVKDIRTKRSGAKLHPAVEEFGTLIDTDPVVRLLITQMIEQIPKTKPYSKRHLESPDQLLLLIDEVIGRAPEYNETEMVGVPLHAVIDW